MATLSSGELTAEIPSVNEDGVYGRAAPDSGGTWVPDGSDLARARDTFDFESVGRWSGSCSGRRSTWCRLELVVVGPAERVKDR